MLHWDFAPENPARLARAGVKIALTSDGMKDQGQFLSQVRRAVERGLEPNEALRALTVTPAELLGLGARLGTLEAGKIANVVVTDGDLFARKTKILETWIEGRRYPARPQPRVDPRGSWRVDRGGSDAEPFLQALRIEGEPENLSGAVGRGREIRLKSARMDGARLTLSFAGDAFGWPGIVRMSATVSNGEMMGEGEWSDGRRFQWTAARLAPFSAPPDTAKIVPVEMASFPVRYPLSAFGRTASARAAGGGGVSRRHGLDLRAAGADRERHGARARAARSRPWARTSRSRAGARVVDAAGKHITPGIIDCHSHTATDGGINEARPDHHRRGAHRRLRRRRTT